MRRSAVQIVLMGLLLVILAGCATTRHVDQSGLPDAEHPEYLANPFRLVALPLHLAGNVLQYGLVEPFYFLLTPVPDAVGLSLEEQRYLAERQEAWRQYLQGERPAVLR
jgi:hypothetical protein